MSPFIDILLRNQGQVLTPELVRGIVLSVDEALPDQVYAAMPGGAVPHPSALNDPRLVTDDKHRVGEWVAQRLGQPAINWGGFGAIGLLDPSGEQLVAGTVINGIYDTNGFAHVAFEGKHALKRSLIYAFFDYAFNQLGLERLTGTVDSTNADALRFDQHLGFRHEFTIPMGSAPDLIQLVMWRDQCRWIKRT